MDPKQGVTLNFIDGFEMTFEDDELQVSKGADGG